MEAALYSRLLLRLVGRQNRKQLRQTVPILRVSLHSRACINDDRRSGGLVSSNGIGLGAPPMTAVDHAELKRVDEILDRLEGPGLPSNMELGAVVVRRSDLNVVISHLRAHAALLSEIEGLKAERDEYERLFKIQCGHTADAFDQLAALRTQAPDSWRPIAEHDNSADEVLVMAEGWTKPIVAWRHHPSSRTDMWLTVPGKYQVKPTEFCPLPALRPQTAESGT